MKKLLCALALGLAATASAQAEDVTVYGTAGDWTIYSHKKDCSTETTLSDGTILRIGFTDKGKKGYLATFNPAWDGFNKHDKYPLSYDLDGTVYEVEGKGVKKDDLPGAEIKFEDPNLLVDLATKHTMIMSVDGAPVVTVDLKGSDEAVKQTLACQEAQ